MNVPRAKLDKVTKIYCSSLHTPTIANLSDENWVAIEVIIDETGGISFQT